MPKPRKDLALFVGMLVPIAHESDAEEFSIDDVPPAGTVVSAQILEHVDVQTPAEWEQVFFGFSQAFHQRVLADGWPVLTDEDVELGDDPEYEEETNPLKEPEIVEPHANIGMDGDPGRCWNCGVHLINNRRGVFCPDGCPDSPDDIEDEDPTEGHTVVDISGYVSEPPGVDPDQPDAPPLVQQIDLGPVLQQLQQIGDQVQLVAERTNQVAKYNEHLAGRLDHLEKTVVAPTPPADKPAPKQPAAKRGRPRKAAVKKPVGKKGKTGGRKLKDVNLANSSTKAPTGKGGSGTKTDPYVSTPENPRPDSFPRNPVLPTTD